MKNIKEENIQFPTEKCPLDYPEECVNLGLDINKIGIKISKDKGDQIINKAKSFPALAEVKELLGLICIIWNTEKCGREVIILKPNKDDYILARQNTNTNARVDYRTPRNIDTITKVVNIK
jgi:hypothetical protein